MSEKYNPELEKEISESLNVENKENSKSEGEDERNEEITKSEDFEDEDYYEELEERLGRRPKKLHKTKYGPKGATRAAQFQRLQQSKFYVRTKRKPKIKVVDKTKK